MFHEIKEDNYSEYDINSKENNSGLSSKYIDNDNRFFQIDSKHNPRIKDQLESLIIRLDQTNLTHLAIIPENRFGIFSVVNIYTNSVIVENVDIDDLSKIVELAETINEIESDS